MCGFAGILDQLSSVEGLRKNVLSMSERIEHRGPDDAGVWLDGQAGVALSHRRLSVLDLSEAGHQPMVSSGGRWVLAYNGEVYNHLALRRRLSDEGVAPEWRGHSDTETFLACVDAWGVDQSLRLSVGMFALALWDRKERQLYLARDRMGEKPLYYGWQNGVFLFGSELQALEAHDAFERVVNRDAIALLLRWNYIPSPHSIFSGISKLLPGSVLRLEYAQRQLEPREYWSLRDVAESGSDSEHRTDKEAVDTLEAVLGDAVRSQMVGDVPLGALLSGGVDSTSIAALMQASSFRPIRTFTIGFDEKAFDEAAHARAVAAHLGTEHTELLFRGSDALNVVPKIASVYDEPFADSSQLPTFLVMGLAKDHVTVALSGDGGDEVFGGYNRYVYAPGVWRRVGWMPHGFRRMLAIAALRVLRKDSRGFAFLSSDVVTNLSNVNRVGEKLTKLCHRFSEHRIRSFDEFYLALTSEWPSPEALVLGVSAPASVSESHAYCPDIADPVSRMMVVDALTYLPDDILTKVDRASMSFSLETRAPLLDRSVVEFAWTLPLHQKIRDGESKWALRSVVDRYVPRSLMDRPKMGFSIPVDEWLRGPLKDWAEALLDESRLREEGFFVVEQVRDAWEAHVRGEASFGGRLWPILMFQAWLQLRPGAK